MSNKHMPESVIIVYGSLGDLGRAWKCFRQKYITIYCIQEDCTKCPIYEEIKAKLTEDSLP